MGALSGNRYRADTSRTRSVYQSDAAHKLRASTNSTIVGRFPTNRNRGAMMQEQKETVDGLLGATSYFTYFWVVGIAILGGVAKFVRELNASATPLPLGRLFIKLMSNLFLAAFAGLMAFWYAKAVGLSAEWQPIAIGISGYLGGIAIDGFAKIWTAIVETKQPKI